RGSTMHSLRKLICEQREPLRIARHVTRLLIVVVLAGFLPACGTWVKTSTGGVPGGGVITPSGGGTGSTQAATLAQIQQQVFTPYCVSCHTKGGLGPMPLTDVATSYANLVNIDPLNGVARSAGLKRVVPGDSTRSYLLSKITGEMQIGEGDRMPQNGAPL